MRVNPDLCALPRVRDCTVCGIGTARRWPSGELECDNPNCGAMGDAFLGLMVDLHLPGEEHE